MSYQIVEGIVKIVNPSGKAVVGIADGKGQFVWLPSEHIKDSFPSRPYAVWQTTRFMVSVDYKVNWKAEKAWDEWKHTYNASNIKLLPQGIPAEFALEPQLSLSAATNIPSSNSFMGAETIQPQKMSPVIQSTQEEVIKHKGLVLAEIKIISANIYKILQLFEKYMKPPSYTTADNIVVEEEVIRADNVLTGGEVREMYGEPPDEPNDGLPDIFEDFKF